MKPLQETTSVNAQVLTALRAAVISGELSPGSLHSVQTLATQLGVSRTPVREALIKLAQQGMVRFERNRGVRVLLTSLHDLEEVFGLRLLLEPPAVGRAVGRLDAAQRRELQRTFAHMEKAARADDEFTMFEHDRRFHRVLLEGSGNARLASFVDGLRDMVLRRGVSTARSPAASTTSSPSTARSSTWSRWGTRPARRRRCARTSGTPRSCSSRRRPGRTSGRDWPRWTSTSTGPSPGPTRTDRSGHRHALTSGMPHATVPGESRV
jgi:DNA-binding GntR family transcriptional regulator